MSKAMADHAAVSSRAPVGAGVMTRRAVLAAVTSAPLCAGPPAARSEMIALCAAWLAIDDEVHHQMARWAHLETRAIEAYDYFRLPPDQIRLLPMRPEMEAIDDRVEWLGEDRQRRLEALGGMRPASLHDVAAQLALAARIMRDDVGDAGPLVRQAAAYLARSRCPSCGESYMPAGLWPG